MRGITFFIALLLIFTGCSNPAKEQPLRISATTWIGYTPLFYAKEKGWLDPLNIKLLNVVSLSENLYLFKAGNSDAYVGTQYERSVLLDKIPTLTPIMLFDRSNGGDIVMSNRSIAHLQAESDTIDVYLEMDSINFTVFEDFISLNKLKEKKFHFINKDQNRIMLDHQIVSKKPTIIVTYSPYDITLKKVGYQTVASTKEGLNLLVVDALFTTQKTLIQHHHQFLALKSLVAKAVKVLHENPKAYFDTIEPYMQEMDYPDFLNALLEIEWIHESPSDTLKARLQQASFPTKDLL